MMSEDQYIDRTPDLVAKVRKMRETAEKEMNRFTCAADYDVRQVVGRKPKDPPQSTNAGHPATEVSATTTGSCSGTEGA